MPSYILSLIPLPLSPLQVCGTSPDGEISQECLDKLVYLDCCLTEALRMCSGSIIMRMVMEPTEITLASGTACFICFKNSHCYLDHVYFLFVCPSGKRYRFRKGDRVGLCPPLWHRDEEIYPEPLVYRPERWMLRSDASAEEIVAASVGRIPMSKGGKELPK